ncbi:MAG: CPBP family intramembrane metalloprotease, partial [Acidobacteriota bacterium]|nr:CPBP family intramembrane metalloprotease [Acidobacteriota bacterium]
MMKRAQWRPLLGVSIAIAITTTMDATGLTVFSALPLFPLMGLFWFLEKFSRSEMGFRLGKLSHHGLAVLHPVAVLGAASVIAALAGVVDLSKTDWTKTWLNLVLGGVTTILVVILTEEGFFRGWLWGSLERAGYSERWVLIWTSIAFSLWHVSAVALDTGFDLPPAQIPVFLVNAAAIGG